MKGLKSLDFSGCRFSDSYLIKGLGLLKLANYEWLAILKLDGCQVTAQALKQIKSFLEQQANILGSSTLQVLSLERCGLNINSLDVGSKRKSRAEASQSNAKASAANRRKTMVFLNESQILLSIIDLCKDSLKILNLAENDLRCCEPGEITDDHFGFI